VHYLDALKEIPFTLKDFCSREDFEARKSTAVRSAFVEGFATNALSLSHTQLLADIHAIEELYAADTYIHLVSHTFRMKVIQLYYKTNGKLFEQPEMIRALLPIHEHLLTFGETIVLDVPDNVV